MMYPEVRKTGVGGDHITLVTASPVEAASLGEWHSVLRHLHAGQPHGGQYRRRRMERDSREEVKCPA